MFYGLWRKRCIYDQSKQEIIKINILDSFLTIVNEKHTIFTVAIAVSIAIHFVVGKCITRNGLSQWYGWIVTIRVTLHTRIDLHAISWVQWISHNLLAKSTVLCCCNGCTIQSSMQMAGICTIWCTSSPWTNNHTTNFQLISANHLL